MLAPSCVRNAFKKRKKQKNEEDNVIGFHAASVGALGLLPEVTSENVFGAESNYAKVGRLRLRSLFSLTFTVNRTCGPVAVAVAVASVQ